MFIDGRMIAISENQYESARLQLELPSDHVMVEATSFLHHDTGNGRVTIPLPKDYLVAAFEGRNGARSYGVVLIKDLSKMQAST